MEQRYMIIDDKENVISIGMPDCVEKRRDYWESRGYRLELADKDDAIKRHQEYLKNQPI